MVPERLNFLNRFDKFYQAIINKVKEDEISESDFYILIRAKCKNMNKGIGEFYRIFERCKQVANKKFDGHMTLYKFTSNWRFCFGTPDDLRIDTVYLYEGKTPEEAMEKALENPRYVEETP